MKLNIALIKAVIPVSGSGFIVKISVVLSGATTESWLKKSTLCFKCNITHRMAWKIFVCLSRLCIIQLRMVKHLSQTIPVIAEDQLK